MCTEGILVKEEMEPKACVKQEEVDSQISFSFQWTFTFFCGRLSPIHLGLFQFFLSLFQTVISFFLGSDFPFLQAAVRVKVEPDVVVKQEPGSFFLPSQSLLKQPTIVFR